MAQVRRLLFADIAPGRDFHAALVQMEPSNPATASHCHDFWEMMYVLEGAGTHKINGRPMPLSAGDILWIRPPDAHAISRRSGQSLHFLNVAFAAPAWAEFRAAAHLETQTAPWETSHLPPMMTLPAAQRAPCALAFEQALHAFHRRPTRLDLCRFWSVVLPFLLPDHLEEAEMIPSAPGWLSRACRLLERQENLQQGVSRLVELAGVSPAHLSRVLKSNTRLTPTEYVNRLRLRHAAALLLTTSQEISRIALDCGFDNLSYFYRRFGQAYGKTPHVFRFEARQGILPRD